MGCALSCVGYYVCCPFEEFRIRSAHLTQKWLLQHPGRFTLLLKKFYITDFILHADPNSFWKRRRKVLGKNFCSIGKVVVSEQRILHELLLGPQERGAYLGATDYEASRLPKTGSLIHISDNAAGGNHSEYRATVDQYIFNGAELDRLHDEYGQGLVAELAEHVANETEEKVRAKHLPEFVMKVLHYCCFGLKLQPEDKDFQTLWALYYEPSPKIGRNLVWYVKYFSDIAEKLEEVTGFSFVGMEEELPQLFEKVAGIYAASPALAGFRVTPEHMDQTVHEFAYSLTAVMGIAGLQGSKSIWGDCLYSIPASFRMPDTAEDLRLCVLEVARAFPAVSGVTCILQKDTQIEMQGAMESFPPGTPVVMNISLQDWDEDTFPRPYEFNPYRANLCPYLCAFNSVGDQSPYRRICPGRELVLQVGVAVLGAVHRRAGMGSDSLAPPAPQSITAPLDPPPLPGSLGHSATFVDDLTSVKYEVVVETGSQQGAGTDGDVRIVLVGSLGESRPMLLDQRWRDDHESGSKGRFSVEVFQDVGTLGAIKLSNHGTGWTDAKFGKLVTLQRSAATMIGLNAAWEIDRVTVQQGGQSWAFPCYTWLCGGETRVFFSGNAMLPLDTPPWLEALRAEDLAATREALQWKPLAGLPHAVAELPLDELWPDHKTYSFVSDTLRFKANEGLANLAGNFTSWDSLEDFRSVYQILQPPRLADNWQSDAVYGASWLAGVSPTAIEQCRAVPEGMRMSPGVQLASGGTLQAEMDAGRVYMLDYRWLAQLEPNRAGAIGHTCAGVCLLHSDPASHRLLPIAIQLDLQSPTAPVFTPHDSLWDWTTAKAYIQNADAVVHQVAVHFIHTHAVCEPFAAAARRQLSPMHPVLRVLRPHLKYTLAINNSARSSLINEGGIIEEVFSMGSHAVTTTGPHAFAHWTGYSNLPRDLEARGMMDCVALPSYPYRDDGMLVWGALSDYLSEYLHAVYSSDAQVREDAELAAFFADMKGGLEPRGSKVFPSSLDTVPVLHTLLLEFCWTVSAQHAAVNFPQYESYGFAPFRPSILRSAPPTAKGLTSESTFVAGLPSRSQTATSVGISKTLASYAEDEEFLGESKQEWLYEAGPKRAMDRFRTRLSEIEVEIETRNKDRPQELKYEYLKPSRIPNSIAI